MSGTSKKTTVKKIKPNENLQLSCEEYSFFYKLLLLCERNKRKPKGYHYDNRELQDFIKEKKMNLPHNPISKEWEGISQESKPNEIQFKNKGAVCSSLFVHLRDAFAHGYIEKDTTTNVLHFQNYDPEAKNMCVMDGRMTFDNLNELIIKMLNTKTKKQ